MKYYTCQLIQDIHKVIVLKMTEIKHFLYELPSNMLEAIIIKRPSKVCKSPYVADIKLSASENEEYLAHTPSLGCCGLTHNGSNVYAIEKENQKTCQYSVELSIVKPGVLVGCNPKMSENLVEYTISGNLFPNLRDITSYKREKKILNSRFDFWGYDENNVEFILEVKTCPLVKYEAQYKSNVSYFPDGYRKSKNVVVSPRALKHVQELEKMKIEKQDKIRCILCFVVQRNDSKFFRISENDQIYKEAVKKAFDNGVEITILCFEWDAKGRVYYVERNIPVLW